MVWERVKSLPVNSFNLDKSKDLSCSKKCFIFSPECHRLYSLFFRPLKPDEILPVRTHRVVTDIPDGASSPEKEKKKSKHHREKDSKKEKKKKKEEKEGKVYHN